MQKFLDNLATIILTLGNIFFVVGCIALVVGIAKIIKDLFPNVWPILAIIFCAYAGLFSYGWASQRSRNRNRITKDN